MSGDCLAVYTYTRALLGPDEAGLLMLFTTRWAQLAQACYLVSYQTLRVLKHSMCAYVCVCVCVCVCQHCRVYVVCTMRGSLWMRGVARWRAARRGKTSAKFLSLNQPSSISYSSSAISRYSHQGAKDDGSHTQLSESGHTQTQGHAGHFRVMAHTDSGSRSPLSRCRLVITLV